MNEKLGQQETGDQSKIWQLIQYANIVRHVPSGIYYARLRIKSKLIGGRSLKTKKISIAKLKRGSGLRSTRSSCRAGATCCPILLRHGGEDVLGLAQQALEVAGRNPVERPLVAPAGPPLRDGDDFREDRSGRASCG